MQKEATKISDLSQEELVALIAADSSRAESALHVAAKNNWVDVFGYAATIPSLNLECIKFILVKMISPSFTNNIETKSNIFSSILEFNSREKLEAVQNEIYGVATSDTKLAAIALVEGNTPLACTYSILSVYEISTVIDNNKGGLQDGIMVLDEIHELLQSGTKPMGNPITGYHIASRLKNNPTDQYATGLSAVNVHPEVAQYIIEQLDKPEVFTRNKEFVENIAKNDSEGFRLAQAIHRLRGSHTTNDAMATIIQEAKYGQSTEYLTWLWGELTNMMMENHSFINNILKAPEGHDTAAITAFFGRSPELARDVTETIGALFTHWPTAMTTTMKKDYPSLEKMISDAINDPALKEIALGLPRDIYNNIRMTPDDRTIIEPPKPITEDEDDDQDLQLLFSSRSKTNWYLESKKLQLEAGFMGMEWKEAIMYAVVGIFLGSSIGKVIDEFKQFNITEDSIHEAMKNPEVVDKAKQIAENIKTDKKQSSPPRQPEITERQPELEIETVAYPTTDNTLHQRMGDTDYQILSEVASQYGLNPTERKLLMVIRILENGRPGCEMGIGDHIPNHPAKRFEGDHNKSLKLQGEWASGTIQKRFNNDLEGFAKRYCNENWESWFSISNRLMNSE